MIVEAAPAVAGPSPSDRNIAIMAEDGAGIYQPRRHVELIRESFERQGKDPEAFIRFRVRRLEALRRAGHVERIYADHWRVPSDLVDRGIAYDLGRGGDGLRVRVLSTLGLEQQIGANEVTWLDRSFLATGRSPAMGTGFGREPRPSSGAPSGSWKWLKPSASPTALFLVPRSLVALWSARKSSGWGRRGLGRAAAPSSR